MVDNPIYCKKCYQIFLDNTSLQRHIKKNTNNCYNSNLLIINAVNDVIDRHRNDFINQKTMYEDALDEQKNVLEQKNELIFDLEKKIKYLEEKHKLEIVNLIHTRPNIKDRMAVYNNMQSREIVANFETVVETTPLDIQTLRNCLKNGYEGDLLLFKKIFFDNLSKESRCIKIRDFARDKYQIFDGQEWLTVTLNHIVEQFMSQIFERYKPVIAEKHAKQAEVDEKFPKWKYKKKNMAEFDRINDLYVDESTHFSELATMDLNHLVKIKTGIRSMISQNKSLIE
jgi:hypothetical protein